ncbi:MAG: glycosyltransferase [Micrococcales bacterium]|nr:glycosyltransferase [Micrococcales bacterium]
MRRRPAQRRTRLRVVVVDHTAELGGAEVALLRLLRALGDQAADTRPDVRVLLFRDGPLVDELRAAGVLVQVVPLAADVVGLDRAAAGRASGANLVRAARVVPFVVGLARRFRRLRPDLVVTTSLKADLLGGVAARLAGRRLVWHLHDRIADDYLPGPLVRLVRAAARLLPHLVIVNSQATAATVPVGRSVDRVVVPPGIGRDWVLDAAAVAARPAPGPHPVVGLVGRISPTKGQLEFVRAAALVARDYPGAVFRIVGGALFDGDDYAARVRAEQQALGLDVRWTGFVADPRAQLDGLDVLVHASPVPEPFGQVIVEAMVRGVPVVATRAGGAVEILQDASAAGPGLGVLVTPGDPGSLADGIASVLADPATARARAAAAHTSAVRRFDAQDTAARVSTAWHRVVPGQTCPIGAGLTAGWSS